MSPVDRWVTHAANVLDHGGAEAEMPTPSQPENERVDVAEDGIPGADVAACEYGSTASPQSSSLCQFPVDSVVNRPNRSPENSPSVGSSSAPSIASSLFSNPSASLGNAGDGLDEDAQVRRTKPEVYAWMVAKTFIEIYLNYGMTTMAWGLLLRLVGAIVRRWWSQHQRDDGGHDALSIVFWALAATSSPTPAPCLKPNFKWIDLSPVGGGAPIQEQCTAATDTHIDLLGGIPPDANNYQAAVPSTTTFEAYSIEEKIWTSLTPIPSAFTHANAAVVNVKINILGGLNGDGVNKIWHAIGVPGDTVYLAGGMERLELFENGTQTSLDIVTAYNTNTGKWTNLPNVPAPRDHVGGAVIGRTFYVVSGRDHGQPNVRNTTWTMNLNAPSKTWKANAEMPTARGGISMGVIGNYIATFGGEGNPAPNSNGVHNETEVYDIKNNVWFKQPAMPHPRHGTVAASLNGRIYVLGGGIIIGAGRGDTFEAFKLTL
ncbi:hypothetical protein GGR54DRAFT_636851 [Hypoxylon sp. NC1633]|nr:hypothetical protein GGR54DRAFT_636851 [Hypoxylon sp. NC1633]